MRREGRSGFLCCFTLRTKIGPKQAAQRRQEAEVCAVCHGVDGLAKIAEAPNLASQNEGYLIAQLTALKSGVRKNEMISIVIQDLSPADIDHLAAYYSAIEISADKLSGQ